MKTTLLTVVFVIYNVIVSSAQIFTPEIKVQIMPNNNIGIGTENPIGKLSISNSGTIGAGIYENSYLYITDGASKLGLDPNQLYSGQDFYFQTATFMKFFTGGSPRLTILQNGKTGIGTENPTGKFTISSTGTIGGGTYSNSFLYITDGNQKLGIDPNQIYAGQDFNFDASTFFRFATSGTERLRILQNGNVGIATTSPSHKLEVNGSIKGTTLHTSTQSWSDFVFETGYNLLTLEEVEEHINENGNLPEIPTEAEVTENGINLGEMDAKLLMKIEELTLYMIDMNKRVNQLELENSELKEGNKELTEKVQSLENE